MPSPLLGSSAEPALPAPPGSRPRPRGGAHRLPRSFGYALQGIATVARFEPNFRLHLALGGGALVLASWLALPASDVATIVLTIGLVLAAEALNTAVEVLANRVEPAPDPLVKRAKDAAAGAVLLAALAALGVAAALFGPRLWRLAVG